MIMHNPPHPGSFIYATYMEPYGISCRNLAQHLDVAASTLNRVLKGNSGISPEMALRLSKTLGRSPQSWLEMQHNFDLWQASTQVRLERVQKLDLSAV
ncbi:HigA family addiction module antitoxin [Aliamphritea hakodatensis]|uniref:HigA family addiction module antitoxin n=1 Tax=Aliamphritea hakodatensis TaxID=2895352 RepID=UPI0022FD9D6B|nr:HigA family addiction module antitoxin [Aliamphritea hakodatensis]